MVNDGSWSPQAYHDYQRMVAGTGNVDSAALLINYGVGATLADLGQGLVKRVHKYVARCDLDSFRRSFNDPDNFLRDFELNDGTSLLMAAAFSGCKPIIETILSMDDDVDIDQVGAHGMTALMIAASKGHRDCVRLLVDHGAAINKQHKFAGTTPLHMAAEMQQAEVVRELCGRGADISAVTSTGSTPIHTAAHVGAGASTINALVSVCGSNVDALMNGDTTPLYLAAQFGHTECVKVGYAMVLSLKSKIVATTRKYCTGIPAMPVTHIPNPTRTLTHTQVITRCISTHKIHTNVELMSGMK